MANDNRFIRAYHQNGGLKMEGAMEVWIDKETGVNYLFHVSGYAGGLCPLLDDNGKPVITKTD